MVVIDSSFCGVSWQQLSLLSCIMVSMVGEIPYHALPCRAGAKVCLKDSYSV